MADQRSPGPPRDPDPIAPKRPARSRFATRAISVATTLGAVAILALGLGGYAFLVSDAGVAFLLREVASRSGGTVTIEGASGSLLDRVRAQRISWQGDTARFEANDVLLDWTPAALWSNGLVISALDAKEIRLEMQTSATDVPPPSSLALPFEVTLERLRVERLVWRVGPNSGTITGLAFGYHGGATAHRITGLALAGDTWKLSGGAAIGTEAPFPISGELRLHGSQASVGGAATIGLSGTLASLAVAGTGTTNGTTFTAKAQLAPLAAVPLRTATVDASAIDLKAWDPSLPETRIEATVRAEPDGNGLAGTLSATNQNAGPLDAGKLPVRAATARYGWGEALLSLDELRADLPGSGNLHGRARIPLGAGAGGGAWSLVLAGVDLSAIHSKLVKTRLAGRIDAELAPERQRLSGDLRDQSMAGGIAVEFAAALAGRTVAVERLRARAGPGSLEGRGSFALSDERAFNFEARTSRLDPARFGTFPKASLDATITARGTAQGTLRSAFEIGIAEGSQLQATPLSGNVTGTIAGPTVRDLRLALDLAGTRIAAEGSAGGADDTLTATLEVPRLAALAEILQAPPSRKLAGTLSAKARWHGPWPDGTGEIHVAGSALELGSDVAAKEVTLDFAVGATASGPRSGDALARSVRLDLKAVDLVGPQGRFHSARANGSGTFAAHTLEVGFDGDGVGLAASARGGFASASGLSSRPGWRWAGTVERLNGRGPLGLTLKAPASLELAPSQARLGAARMAIGDGTLNIDELAWADGSVRTRGTLASVPLATVARFAGTPLPVGSTLTLAGDWSVAAGPRLNGTVNLRRDGGDLQVEGSGQAGTPARVALGITKAEIVARLADDAIAAEGSVLVADGGTIAAKLSLGTAPDAVPGRIGGNAPLSLKASADVPSLQWLRHWIGTSAVFTGRARADVTASGTLAKPALAGNLDASNLRLDAPPWGISYKDGRLRARLADGRLMLDEFAWSSGGGEFRADGTIASITGEAGANAQIGWRANRFRLLNRPDLHLTVDGDGSLALMQGKLVVSGNLKALEGNIAYENDAESTLGSDVVVKGWPPRETSGSRAADLPLAVDLAFDLGNRLHFAGEGLDTGLRGMVRVTTGPRGLIGKGSIRSVNGTYRAFGQKLVIDPGRLIFDGPLDNPGLDIIALRKNLAVEAGVAVTGTVQVPVIRLTSEPPVSDSEKLAWLVLGHGLEGTSGPDLSALQAASALLLGRNSKPITTAIAETVGVDDISFKPAAAPSRPGSSAQGGVVAIGKKLTNRLSLIYEQGLTVANSAVKLEYALNRNVTLRASTGVVSNVGIQFQKSFE